MGSPCRKLRERESKDQGRSWAATGRAAEADKDEGDPGGAGWGRTRGERRSRAGGEKGKEAEVPGGHGARAGSGEGRRAGAPEKRPDFLPARARKPESGRRPGIAEPDLGRPAGHLPARTPGTPSLAPPGLLLPPPRGGAGRGPGAEGLPGCAQRTCCRLSLASVFSSVKESKKKTRRGGARLSSQELGSRQEDCHEFEVSLGDLA